MSTTAAPSVAAEPLWFLANRAVVRVASRETEGRLSIVELSGARGDMPPLHVHTRDDEAFHVLAGELSLFVGASCSVARAGDTVLAPRGIPHAVTRLTLNGTAALGETWSVTLGGVTYSYTVESLEVMVPSPSIVVTLIGYGLLFLTSTFRSPLAPG